MTDLPTVTSTPGLPPELIEQTQADAGCGVSDQSSDFMTPLLLIAQAISPAVDRHDPAYIENLEPGDWYIRNTVDPVRKIIGSAIFCALLHTHIEWMQGRQGYVTRHIECPADVESCRTDSRHPTLIRKTNGNLVVPTSEVYLIADGIPCLLSCSSTKHLFVRQLQTNFLRYRHPRTGDVLPSFARRYELKTTQVSNQLGRWYAPTFRDVGWTSLDEYGAAKNFHGLVERGALRIEQSNDNAVADAA